MAVTFRDVTLSEVGESGEIEVKVAKPLVLQILDEQENLLLRFKEDETSAPITNLSIELYKDSETARFGQKSYVIRDETGGSTGSSSTSILLQFARESDVIKFAEAIRKFKQGNSDSVFAQRTDDSSAVQYFQFYGYLSQQQNMMQDYIRTSTYQKAILSNTNDFKDKTVLDVGAGSGILSFFAIQSGARKVYAVEASSMAKHAEQLVYSNKLTGKITVISGKIEEISLPEMVDIIISEPMGYMLFNERMLETYLHAKKWLKPGGRMFPTRGDLHIAPFSDAALYMEQLNKANFWYQENFHGVDLSSLRSAAVEEYFKQPVVDTFDVRICTAKSVRYSVDFEKASENDLHKMVIPVSFTILQTGEIHGLAFWFDVAFLGSQHNVWLSTAPTQPLTHWYQVRCLIDTPLFLHRGQILTGTVTLASNKRQSYDVIVELVNPGTGSKVTNVLDLKNPYFRYTGQPPQPPPGTYETSPSEAYWSSMDTVNTPVNASNSSNNTIATAGAVLNGSSAMATDGHHSYGDANAVGTIIGANNTATANSTGINHYSALATGPAGNTTHHPMNTQIIGIVPTVHQSSTSSIYPGGAISTTLASSSVANSNHTTGNNAAAPSNNRSASPLQLGRSGTPVSFTPNPGNNSFQMSGHHVIPPCSIGGGISPSLFTSTLHSTGQNAIGSIGQGVTVLNSLPFSNNLMIGDYASTSTVISGHHHPQPGQQMLHKQ